MGGRAWPSGGTTTVTNAMGAHIPQSRVLEGLMGSMDKRHRETLQEDLSLRLRPRGPEGEQQRASPGRG